MNIPFQERKSDINEMEYQQLSKKFIQKKFEKNWF